MNSRLRLGLACVLLSGLALLVRGLYLADGVGLLYTPEQDGTRMARRYDDSALSILRGEGVLFPKVRDPERTGLAARPPGYPLFLAAIYAVLGRSFPIVAGVQDVLTSVATLLVFGFGCRWFGPRAGVLAGLLAALSPHLAATSNLILADAIASLPLLVGFLVAMPVLRDRSSISNQAARLVVLGVFIGLGVWLRPNVVLLGPFASVLLFFLLGRTRRSLLLASLVTVSSLLVVAPITVRNWLVFGEFVPVSINGGITLWQGVADAGGTAFGARVWDKQVMAEEAERYGRPDYLLWWAEPDGIARDRDRYRRAVSVIMARPFWYAQAMVRRMASMMLFSDGPRGLRPSGGVVGSLEGERVPLPPAPDFDVLVDEASFARTVGMASFLRGPLGLLHRIWPVVPLLAWLGIALALREAPRPTLLWLVVPLYYLIFESPFLYEWRVAVPMQYFLLPFAGKAAAEVVDWLVVRGDRKIPGTP
jgi:4-amino-4-deoxy-L-arabinose transferase-like glycosyltransferase